MKKTTKFLIFVLLIFSSLLIFTNYSKAAETETATDESSLRSAIENVK